MQPRCVHRIAFCLYNCIIFQFILAEGIALNSHKNMTSTGNIRSFTKNFNFLGRLEAFIPPPPRPVLLICLTQLASLNPNSPPCGSKVITSAFCKSTKKVDKKTDLP